jgi:hypothetical protein
MEKKSYNSKSPEYVKSYNQDYYKKRKEQYSEQKAYCSTCRTELNLNGLLRHNKTKRHIRLTQLEQEELNNE